LGPSVAQVEPEWNSGPTLKIYISFDSKACF
jgi:hypothetical protein